ncbi:hypothetical protein MKX01_017443, partial [Papaver californicum]
KKDESKESDFSDAVNVCLPLIHAAIRDIENEDFPRSCSLNIEVPTSPSTNKGFKVTKQSLWKPSPSWTAVSANRQPGAWIFMPNQQGLGFSLAQLGRDASASGAARPLTTQRKNVEVESVGVAGKTDTQRVKRYFRLESFSYLLVVGVVEREKKNRCRRRRSDRIKVVNLTHQGLNWCYTTRSDSTH